MNPIVTNQQFRFIAQAGKLHTQAKHFVAIAFLQYRCSRHPYIHVRNQIRLHRKSLTAKIVCEFIQVIILQKSPRPARSHSITVLSTHCKHRHITISLYIECGVQRFGVCRQVQQRQEPFRFIVGKFQSLTRWAGRKVTTQLRLHRPEIKRVQGQTFLFHIITIRFHILLFLCIQASASVFR